MPPNNMIQQTLVRVCFVLLRKHLRNDYGFAQYVSELFSKAKIEKPNLLSLLKRETTNYVKIVKEEENPALWWIAFKVYAFLYTFNLISFDDIVNIYLSIPEESFLPPIHTIMYKIAEVTGIPLDYAETLPEKFNNYTPDFIDSLISICDPISEIKGKETEISVGVFIRSLFDDAFVEETLDFAQVFEPHKKVILDYCDKYPEMIKRNVEYIIETSDLTPEQTSIVRSYFKYE